MSALKTFVYDDCIDGVDFPKEQERRPLDDESKFKNYNKSRTVPDKYQCWTKGQAATGRVSF